MRSVRLATFLVIVTAVAVGGCRTDSGSSDAKSTPRGAASASPTATTSPSGSGAALDPTTKTACSNVKGDIDTTLTKVADAEKIGPPAGHLAVSAQYSAGAAGIYAHIMENIDQKVDQSADQVATALSDLGEKYATPPNGTPDKTALNNAITQFKTACGFQ